MEVVINIVKWTLLTLGGLFLIAVALVMREVLWIPVYEDSNPRYENLVRQIDELGQSLRTGKPMETQGKIDLSELNGGAWTTACMFGGYINPLDKMIDLGANIVDQDRSRLMELKTRGFRTAQVEEFEIMIAFIDAAGTANFILFQNGIGSGGQHLEECITKPQAVLDLFAA